MARVNNHCSEIINAEKFNNNSIIMSDIESNKGDMVGGVSSKGMLYVINNNAIV